MIKAKSFWPIVLIMLGQSCYAGVYKCQVKGKTVYQDAPCDGAQPEAGKIKLTTPQMTIDTLKRTTAPERVTDALPSPPTGATTLPSQPAGANSMSGSIDELSGDGLGLSAESALRKFGRPHKINRTRTASGVREQWVYGGGQYVYLDNGRVTAVQDSEGSRR